MQVAVDAVQGVESPCPAPVRLHDPLDRPGRLDPDRAQSERCGTERFARVGDDVKRGTERVGRRVRPGGVSRATSRREPALRREPGLVQPCRMITGRQRDGIDEGTVGLGTSRPQRQAEQEPARIRIAHRSPLAREIRERDQPAGTRLELCGGGEVVVGAQLPPEPVERRPCRRRPTPEQKPVAGVRRQLEAGAVGGLGDRPADDEGAPEQEAGVAGLPYAGPRDVDVGVVGPGGNRGSLRYTEGAGCSTGSSPPAIASGSTGSGRETGAGRPASVVVGRGDRIHRRHTREPCNQEPGRVERERGSTYDVWVMLRPPQELRESVVVGRGRRERRSLPLGPAVEREEQRRGQRLARSIDQHRRRPEASHADRGDVDTGRRDGLGARGQGTLDPRRGIVLCPPGSRSVDGERPPRSSEQVALRADDGSSDPAQADVDPERADRDAALPW